MFGIKGIWLYLLIFCGKLIEVTFGTLRITFSSKGKRAFAAMTGFVEITIWVLLASSVLQNVTEDPLKMVAYCVAFSGGILLGTALEQRLAVGLTSIQIVVSAEEAERLGASLRDNGFGVTIMDGRSVDGTARSVVLVQLRRKLVQQAVTLAKNVVPEAVISVSDVRSVSGGFLR